MIKLLVDKFLRWKLPRDFSPDAGISFNPPITYKQWPVGTNLFTATQAEVMFSQLLDGVPCNLGEAWDRIAELEAQLAECQRELERERIRLAACGVVALSNTPESAAKAREMNDEYHSASCDDVAAAVDREMAFREQLAKCQRERDALRREVEVLRLYGNRDCTAMADEVLTATKENDGE